MKVCSSLFVIVFVLPTIAQATNHIVFPPRKSASAAYEFVKNERPQCAGTLGLCDGELPDYPSSEFIEKSLKKSKLTPLGEVADPLDKLSTRFDFGDDDGWIQETPACSSVERVLYPKQAETRDNKWLYILNDKRVIQGIRVETCANEGGPGRVAPEATVCRQKYIYRRLLAFNATGGAAPDSFRIPSCCVCYVKADYLGHRFGPGTKINATSTASQASITMTTAAAPAQLHNPSVPTSHSSSSIQFGPSANRRSSRTDIRSLPRSKRDAVSQTPNEQTSPNQEKSGTARDTPSTSGNFEGQFVGGIEVESNPLFVQAKHQRQVTP